MLLCLPNNDIRITFAIYSRALDARIVKIHEKDVVMIRSIFFQSMPVTKSGLYYCKITERDVLNAQQAWGDAIVKIGASSHPHSTAERYISDLYAYNLGIVLFKPTMARKRQFRGTKEEALSYFVGRDGTEDRGFAMEPFVKVRFENEGIITECGYAVAMGNYYFIKNNGEEIKVEYTFGYIGNNGKLKINLHHSSFPYGSD